MKKVTLIIENVETGDFEASVLEFSENSVDYQKIVESLEFIGGRRDDRGKGYKSVK